ncbi:MAG: alanine racemase [Oscillospiraceae bacterium]|nr:alanine racemase [Oscillospiraceae bacterium]
MNGQPWRGDVWQEIDLDALRHNLAQTRAHANNLPIAAVVKADAYGHGMPRAARAFYEGGAKLIATASIREALSLRARFRDMPLWAMGAVSEDLLLPAIKERIAVTLCSLDEARRVSSIAAALNAVACAHLKLDTGFHRLGMTAEDAIRDIPKILEMPALRLDGLFTHLALLDEAHDRAQIERFERVNGAIEASGFTIPKHVADSIALFRYPQWRYGMARVGALLYGSRSRETPFKPHTAMRLRARIVSIRDIPEGDGVGYDETYFVRRPSRIATLPIGYADGLIRRLSARGQAALCGMRAPYAGLPCMDQLMIDVTDIPQARVGDTATLLGGEGADAISLEEFANWIGSNRNEPMCLTGRRVPRVYYENGKIIAVDDPLLGQSYEL